MFGTDNTMDEELYRNQFRWLETADDYFEPWGYPGQGRWLIYGMKLPDEVELQIEGLLDGTGADGRAFGPAGRRPVSSSATPSSNLTRRRSSASRAWMRRSAWAATYVSWCARSRVAS